MRSTAAALVLAALMATAAGCAAQTPAPATGGTSPAAPSPAAAGPFRVKLDSCSGTSLTATVTNAGHAAAAVQVQGEFTRGGLVDDANTSGFTVPLRPGQREHVTIDNVTDAGKAGNPADTCQLLGYAVNDTRGELVGTWPLPG